MNDAIKALKYAEQDARESLDIALAGERFLEVAKYATQLANIRADIARAEADAYASQRGFRFTMTGAEKLTSAGWEVLP